MPDEQMAETKTVDTPTVASPPEAEVKEVTEQVTETATESQTAEPQADVTEEQGEHKSTRAERRVQQLLDKLKDKPQVQDIPQPTQQVDENEIDPTAVQFVDQRVQQATQQTVQQIRAELAYESVKNEHISDIEKSTEGLDPRVERLAVKQYQAMNHQINPFTGQEVFIPTVKFSEIVKSIQADLEDITASKVADAQTSLARQAQESAVQPSGNTSGRFSLNEARKDIWKNPGKVAKELESRLTYSED